MLKTETLNLRVSGEFKRRLIEEARREKRSVTNYIEVAITELWSKKALAPVDEDKKSGMRKRILGRLGATKIRS